MIYFSSVFEGLGQWSKENRTEIQNRSSVKSKAESVVTRQKAGHVIGVGKQGVIRLIQVSARSGRRQVKLPGLESRSCQTDSGLSKSSNDSRQV